MIRIFKDNDIKLVTQGVYNSLYKPLGYKPIIEEKKQVKVVQQKVEIEDKEPKEPIDKSSTTRRKKGE